MIESVHTSRRAQTRLKGLAKLSRWQEHVLFTLPATLTGAAMAARHAPGVTPDARVLLVTAAALLAVTVAFMVNDVEDAPDDAREMHRAARNPVTSGEVTARDGWIAAWVLGAIALLLYASASTAAFWIGALTLALAVLYSWRGVRLKALPVVDVISHALMLSTLLFLAGYFAYDTTPGRVWWVAFGLGLISAYGQLYNQVRDYDMDRAAKLHNTANIVGRRGTQRWMYAALGAAALCLLATVIMGLWPLWLALVPLALLPLLWRFRPRTDMRGTEAIDLSGRIQWSFFIAANVAALVWLLVEWIG
ncbi:UbiA family prenyltransferase [Aggregatilinea lenta]|uniref:UbiA family prenyltransferase n=1 Tax=Aggregatilinea lenta TaxID=913108 RepID=UPI000E5BF967|nr:UbiA family prenyltransferase [Aggregatilinea lenta]